MKNKIGLLLATVMVLNCISSVAYAFKNPLTEYDLYKDTHPDAGSSSASSGVLPMLGSSGSSKNNGSSGSGTSGYSTPTPEWAGVDDGEVVEEQSRNEHLRDSSRRVFSDQESTPAWEVGPVYYENPTLDSIIEKYRKSDFAGCMQECVAYVRKYPEDTLGFYYLAMSYTKVNDKDNAIRAYEKVITLDDNPLIVKYATNGRNCIMGNSNEKCFENVNEPELVYPYANVVTTELTPVDPETLVDRNLKQLRDKLSPQIIVGEDEQSSSGNDKDKDKNKIVLPFGAQDEKLDKFINAPYGNGLSPELNKEYKQLQLKKIQTTINTGEDSSEKETRDLKYIKKFDNSKSDLGTDRLAYAGTDADWAAIEKDPEYIRQKQEIEQLNSLLGNESSNKSDDIMNLLPYMSEKGDKKLSPEVIQAMMMKSVMGDLTL